MSSPLTAFPRGQGAPPAAALASRGFSQTRNWRCASLAASWLSVTWASLFTSQGLALPIHKMGQLSLPSGLWRETREGARLQNTSPQETQHGPFLPTCPLWRKRGTPGLRQKWHPWASAHRGRSLAEVTGGGRRRLAWPVWVKKPQGLTLGK